MKYYTQMSKKDRQRLFIFLELGLTRREIARRLGKHFSSIYREIQRNREEERYLPGVADQKSLVRKQARQLSKLEKKRLLREKVIGQLKEGLSPEQIAGRMKLKKEKESVCHETIYRFIYQHKEQALYGYLRYKKPKRQRRFERQKQTCRFGEKRLITHRPSAIQTRKRIGHWEGDGIEFTVSRQETITTLVERKSRRVGLIKNKTKQSQGVMEKIGKRFKKMPKKMRATITFDQGSEFADYRQLEEETHCRVYYCEKRSPWQKGSNENMNGRLRRYLPRSREVAQITQEELDLLAEKLNNQPRKCLGFYTPLEV
ncbi:MAG: transposase, partial [Gammaproteobacteria bacterium RIFOXYB2_FULL_38_6]